jgi:serine/threonine protein kinase
MYLISEHYQTTAAHLMQAGEPTSPQINGIAHDMLEGLKHLHERGIVSRNVSLDNTLITKSGRAVLSNYGLYYATEWGKSVVFPIGDVLYFAPELVVRGPYSSVVSTPKEDVR